MTRIHDVGGRRGFGPVPQAEEVEPPFTETWHARVFALVRVLIARGVMSHNEFRFAREQMPPNTYLSASYYERLLHALETVLVADGVLDAEDLAREQGAVAGKAQTDAHG